MRKNKRPELSQVVEDIYDAALDSARWKDTIAKIADYVGGQAGGLALKDCQSNNVNVFYDVGFDQECIEVYLQTYSKFDPLATAPLFDLRQVASVPDLMPYDEYLKGRFYREWAQPQGWLDSANAIIERSGTSSTLLRIVTSKNTGLVDDNMRGRMAQVVPHVRRATLVGKSMDLKRAEAAMLAETLDGLSAGLFLVDAKARVVHANDAARDILEAGDFLRSIGGRLVARDAEINQTLRDIFAVAGDGDSALGNRGIALRLTARDGERYAAHVLPLSSGERRRAGIAYAAVAAMFVCSFAASSVICRSHRPDLPADPHRASRLACRRRAGEFVRGGASPRHRRYDRQVPSRQHLCEDRGQSCDRAHQADGRAFQPAPRLISPCE
jgi:PAS domain-containing protein